MHNNNPTEFLAMHAIATLPDSVKARKRILGAVTGALPRNNQTRNTAAAILLSMRQQEKLQEQLALAFAEINAK